MQENQGWSLGWEDPLEESVATHSSTLVWRIPWQKILAGYSLWGCRVRYDWACRHTCTYPRASVSSIPEPFVLCGANDISWQPIAPNSETHSFYWKYIWEFFMDFVYRSAWKQLLFVPISAIPCLSFTLIWVRWINPDMLEIKSNINWLIGPLACASLNTAKNKQTISPLQRSETPWPLKQREDHHKFIIWSFYREIHASGFI